MAEVKAEEFQNCYIWNPCYKTYPHTTNIALDETVIKLRVT